MLSVTTEATVTRERPHPGPSADHERPWSRRSTCRAPSLGRLRLLEAEQALPHHEQVRERARDHEPMAILAQPAIAHLREAEDAFDHPNGMFDAGANAGLPPIHRAPFGRSGPTMDEVTRVRRAHAEDGGLASVRRVAPDPPFVAVQQPGQDVAVVNVGRRDFDGVNQLALAVDPEAVMRSLWCVSPDRKTWRVVSVQKFMTGSSGGCSVRRSRPDRWRAPKPKDPSLGPGAVLGAVGRSSARTLNPPRSIPTTASSCPPTTRATR